MKYFLWAISIFFSTYSFAQIEKGTVMTGGNFSLQTGEGASEFVLTPNVGFFVGKNFALGGFVNFSDRKIGNTKVTEFGIGPFARYYFGTTNTKPFVVTEFDYLTSTTKNGDLKNTENGFGFLLGMGFAAFINETVAVEGISGYRYSNFQNVDGVSGFALRFGFQIYLNNNSMRDLKRNVIGE
jgi:hypothetical protein